MERILLINDCKFESFIMKDLLKELGYEVEITNEYNAVADVREFSPNIVIANFIMKEKQGDKLLAEIKNMGYSIRCILSTSSNVTIKDFNASIIEQVIHTPISKEKLIEALKYNYEYTNFTQLKVEYSKRDIFEKLEEKATVNKRNENSINKSEFYFCPYCGKKLMNSENNIKFCPYCEERL